MLLPVACALALTAAAPRVVLQEGAPRLEDATGRVLADLGAEVVFQAAGGKLHRARIRSWSALPGPDGAWGLEGFATTGAAGWRLVWRARPSAAIIALEVSIAYGRATDVALERVDLLLPDAAGASVLDRAYRWVAPPRRLWVDATTPHVVRAPGLTVLGRAPALEVARTGKALRVGFELDAAHQHPWRPFKRCWPRYEASQEGERLDRSATSRSAGASRDLTAAVLVAGDLDPLLPLRFPFGRRAALVVTDHADQTALPRFKALMLGASTAGLGSAHGWAGHGLGMTKTLFRDGTPGYAAQLEDPDFMKLVHDLVQGGLEVGPHSATGGPDQRPATAAALAVFEGFGGRVWIDHQPSTNCEALANQGAVPGSRWYVEDLLRDKGFRYAWATYDVPEPSDGINLLDPRRPQRRVALLYERPGGEGSGDRVWLFPSVWRLLPFARFLRAYAPNRIERLFNDQGLHVAHTYLEAPPRGGMRARSLLRPRGDGFELDPKAEALFASLAAYQERGLWVAGMGAVGDHLRAIRELEMQVAPEAVTLVYHGTRPVRGVALLVPEALAGDLRVDGVAPDSGRWLAWQPGYRALALDFGVGEHGSRSALTLGPPPPQAGRTWLPRARIELIEPPRAEVRQ